MLTSTRLADANGSQAGQVVATSRGAVEARQQPMPEKNLLRLEEIADEEMKKALAAKSRVNIEKALAARGLAIKKKDTMKTTAADTEKEVVRAIPKTTAQLCRAARAKEAWRKKFQAESEEDREHIALPIRHSI